MSMYKLEGDHLIAFSCVLSNIFSTAIAESTFAQIVDGLPTRDNVGYFPTYSREIRDNVSPSAEAIAIAREVLGDPNSHITEFDSQLAQVYQTTTLGTPEFFMRLLEKLAVACHDLAGIVYLNHQPGLRRAGQSPEERCAALEGRPTDFMHEDYHHYQQYPKGVADVVGYWAEHHIFGGVLLFDRGESGKDCKSAFLHPVGGFRIFQISEPQLQHFSEYVNHLVNDNSTRPPFPFRAEKYAYRVDPFDAMLLNIYRDRYERLIPTERPSRCVQRLADFPELQDAMADINRGGSR